jgi:magnesium-transporting ATPase (P-type)
MSAATSHSTTHRTSVGRRMLRAVVTVVKALVWTAVGALAYVTCQGMFGGYPKIHSALLTTIGMILIAVTGGLAWILDERRGHGDE